MEATTGIGGVTVLLGAGEIKNTYVEEMLDISAASNQPRTAISITTNKKMIIFVCEGRNMTEGVAGLTTANVAKVMKDLGCTEALNLDGGGSSCMLVNGKETIKAVTANKGKC
ncbi:phosphodiester glycosidase family protein [Bacteroides thetaiotaomicron]|nr:phosphodiester glycosidase family protein [Bacteroides thetaiotaomicron]MCS2687410.1 phosphodiester glycosidase family protein [Bacteroides thetaiotaomicron]